MLYASKFDPSILRSVIQLYVRPENSQYFLNNQDQFKFRIISFLISDSTLTICTCTTNEHILSWTIVFI